MSLHGAPCRCPKPAKATKPSGHVWCRTCGGSIVEPTRRPTRP